MHRLRTRHDSNHSEKNAIDFYVWKIGLNTGKRSIVAVTTPNGGKYGFYGAIVHQAQLMALLLIMAQLLVDDVSTGAQFSLLLQQLKVVFYCETGEYWRKYIYFNIIYEDGRQQIVVMVYLGTPYWGPNSKTG